MDTAFFFIHAAMPVIYLAMLAAVIAKFVMVARYKEADFVVFFLSFFVIYSKSNIATSGTKRKKFMLYNNLINIFLYTGLLLFVVMLITYGNNVFNYS